MKEFFAKKTIWAYVGLLGIILAFVTMILGVVTKGLVGDTFPSAITIMLVFGIATGIAAFIFDKWKFLIFLPIIFLSVALSIMIYGGAEVIADYLSGVYNVGGNFDFTVAYVILTLFALAVYCVIAFFNQRKEVQ